ncbi:uncharacterized protein LOC143069771 isoform X1 [Mytilus galloprovincialis]|uniref:TJP4 n=1 Tax=Mytilus edulis TaxID=6550 RepID=A0A8S3QJL1_MYTED|nr:PILT [Mytilus edulis]
MHRREQSADLILSSLNQPQEMSKACKECGCTCNGFSSNSSLDMHQQIEGLESQLRKSNTRLSEIEHELIYSKVAAESEVLKLRDELNKLRDRYDRLYESHKKLQKVNHNLEDKLLKVVSGFESEKMGLQKEMSSVTSKLVEARLAVTEMEEENDRYRTDCNIAVQLLQCRPSNFISHKLNTLPIEFQERVKKHMTQEQRLNCEEAPKSDESTQLIRVPMPTFPPTAMVYSINNPTKDEKKEETNGQVPMNLITKVLTPNKPRRKPRRVYLCVKCNDDVTFYDKEVQVNMSRDSVSNHSNSRVHRPHARVRTNSAETDI